MSSEELHLDAFEIARRYGLPATYDGQYLALARKLAAECWTADARLLRALPSLRWVKWLGDYPV